ncbi:hypothetical protein [Corallibacter sp.]|uniref:hypothetical protein n=1 Tax=Corallibacter sp. TaxID=2038084 RepID=UPI003AB481A8
MNRFSIIKGEEFENFVHTTIFPKNQFDLIHRTNSFEQNSERFSRNTMLPDFKFECKTSKKQFYVEAKFRSNFNNHNKLEVLTKPQFDRYKEIQETEKTPVFIILGYEGAARNPDHISLIPINEFDYLNMYRSKLIEFDIDKKAINVKYLKLDEYKFNNDLEKIIKQDEKTSSFYKPKRNWFISASVILVLIIGFSITKSIYGNDDFSLDDNTSSLQDNESNIKNIIQDYYKNLDAGDLSKLKQFINPIVDKWYSKQNLTLEQIIKQQKAYQEKYPYRKTNIRWNTFEIENNGKDYIATYQLDYSIKSPKWKNFKKYNLKITSVWGQNLKLKSMYEDKL